MKKVLIALDYSATAQQIAELGHDLATSIGARTILLHVVSDVTYYSSLNYSPIIGFGNLSNVIETDTAERLQELAEKYLYRLKQHLGGDKIETVVEHGDFGEMILDAARKCDVDMIVMGTHSRRGIEKLLVGSVAEKVLRSSLIPLFIIPTKAFA